MHKFYSKVTGELLHVVFRIDDFVSGRTEIIEPDQFIQCAALQMNAGKTFRPHKHNVHEVTDKDRIAQESWVVLMGTVRCVFYDVNDEILATAILSFGDASFTLKGGHTYFILEDNTTVYEFKTGKYLGQTHDKTFIDE